MTRRNKIFTGLALFLAVTFIGITLSGRGHFRLYRADVYRVEKGWGYDIIMKNKVYIHQPYMPVARGMIPFPDKKSALRAAKLVIKKLRNHKSPAISLEELKSVLPPANRDLVH